LKINNTKYNDLFFFLGVVTGPRDVKVTLNAISGPAKKARSVMRARHNGRVA